MKNNKESLAKKRVKILRLFSKNPKTGNYEVEFKSGVAISEDAMMLIKTENLEQLVVNELRDLKKEIMQMIDEAVENITKE